LDQVFIAAQSDILMERLAANKVFEAIPFGDRDNRYQGMIEKLVSKSQPDIMTLDALANIVDKQKMATALPGIMNALQGLFKIVPKTLCH